MRVEVPRTTPRCVLDLGAGLVGLRRVPTEDDAAVLHERGVVVGVELRREVLLHLFVAHVHVRVRGDDPFRCHRFPLSPSTVPRRRARPVADRGSR